MSMEMTFVADTTDELVEQVLAFARRLQAIAIETAPQTPQTPEPRSPEPPAVITGEDIKPAINLPTGSDQGKQPVKRKHRRVNPAPTQEGTGAGAPEPQTNGLTVLPVLPGDDEPVDNLGAVGGKIPGTVPLTDETVSEAMQEVITAPAPPKAALALKEDVINALQQAFRAGKIQKVRQVLSQYGNGAKSFREIDIAAFPEISKALKAGALN